MNWAATGLWLAAQFKLFILSALGASFGCILSRFSASEVITSIAQESPTAGIE
jgi:hypothetical protein